MNLLIVDVETTGLSPTKNSLIEIGAILFSVKHKKMLQCFSTLLPCDINPVENINNIPASLTLERYNIETSIKMLDNMAFYADALVAHNAPFDKGFLENINELKHADSYFNKRPWICTKSDFKWPSRPSRLRLVDVCESLKVPYVNAHRALRDCELIAECFNKVDDLQDRIEKLLGVG